MHRPGREPAQHPAHVDLFSLCQTLLHAGRRISS
jgi:hypothetical protein